MANTETVLADPLFALRQSIAAGSNPVLTTSSDIENATSQETSSLAQATHLFFTAPISQCIPLSTPTRFVSSGSPVDLRSIYFAWQKKDVAIPEYISAAQELDSSLPEGQKIRNLVFVERLDLITWLEGASEESEYITPAEGGLAGPGDPSAAKAADASAQLASGTAGGVATVPSAGASGAVVQAGGRPVKVLDARLQEIYNGERRMGDRNTVLRGIKPTDFSHIRKTAEAFLGRHRRPQANQPSRPGAHPSSRSSQPSRPVSSIPPSMPPTKPTSSSKRQDPIILLSPSASSLLRLSNIKSFLDTGHFVPPDHPVLASHSGTNLLHITRQIKALDQGSSSNRHSSQSSSTGSSRPYRFITVDTPEQFKPDYWSRVVAVFTTGQTWQFKSYKWRDPPELFKNVLGVYVGWRGEEVPAVVKGWGRGVACFQVERWDEKAHGQAGEEGLERRWRDREVVEGVWGAIEGHMKARGWGSGK